MKIPILLYLLLETFVFVLVSSFVGFFIVLLLTIGTAIIGILILKKLWTRKIDLDKKNYLFLSRSNGNSISNDFFSLLVAVLFIVPGFLTDALAFFLLNKRSRNYLKHIIMNKVMLNTSKKASYNHQNETIKTSYEEIKD